MRTGLLAHVWVLIVDVHRWFSQESFISYIVSDAKYSSVASPPVLYNPTRMSYVTIVLYGTVLIWTCYSTQ